MGQLEETIKVITEPFLGIYTTKEVIEDFSGN